MGTIRMHENTLNKISKYQRHNTTHIRACLEMRLPCDGVNGEAFNRTVEVMWPVERLQRLALYADSHLLNSL